MSDNHNNETIDSGKAADLIDHFLRDTEKSMDLQREGVDQLKFICSKLAKSLSEDIPDFVENLTRDPYWPKWTAPWWKIMLLDDAGHGELLAPEVVHAFLKGVNSHYIKTFPLTEDQIPEGCDPYRHILCLCAAGCVMRFAWNLSKTAHEKQTQQALHTQQTQQALQPLNSLTAWNPREFLQWPGTMLRELQMEDGGFNCDEGAYLKKPQKSSVVSTLPCLEALLVRARARHDDELDYTEEKMIIEKGVAYLSAHRLFRSTKGNIIDKEWFAPLFPRFYNYDILRGLEFMSRWYEFSGIAPDLPVIAESLEILNSHLNEDGLLNAAEQSWTDWNLIYTDDGGWEGNGKGEAFTELSLCSSQPIAGAVLTARAREVMERLKRCMQQGDPKCGRLNMTAKS
ncbi:MAG: hypothetical protein CVV64_20145 [Candidatus Wallbacteria bacterium HGW-Wallbacteria-1]|jgi:hypothetical protein|uniref:Squalene cyclase C-terminal domain-containing protein n=1 Tax=Candidatus Wallbacteria bacterium HGW-Wallbacteria-1 TaxID=2013854 RepID=A0A2N1PIG3_9BACT|nr:MAG: hypothetical protein CVV64_20145 [Candidatus Wallbacteria bacterium HGW-Wallbacteria-1]